MKLSKLLFGLTLVILFSFSSTSLAIEPVLQDQAQTILAKWFSIDPQHDIKMQKTAMPTDELGKHFQLSFISDDQQVVNGVLAMSALQNKPIKLALIRGLKI